MSLFLSSQLNILIDFNWVSLKKKKIVNSPNLDLYLIIYAIQVWLRGISKTCDSSPPLHSIAGVGGERWMIGGLRFFPKNLFIADS